MGETFDKVNTEIKRVIYSCHKAIITHPGKIDNRMYSLRRFRP
jgi:hypothetical protein